MRRGFRTSLIAFVALCLVAFTVFNILGEKLHEVDIKPVSPWWILPFVLLLLSIAVMPFINRHWWEENYAFVAFSLGALVVIYYMLMLPNPPRMALTFYEYVSFICLIGSLFVVAGGIHVRMKGRETPWENVRLLAVAALASNVLGTTGASMLAIRPYLRLNRFRIRPYHVVFFIFIVSNMGGALTPIGDPPLFLGYLKGIPFFWILGRAWLPWLVALSLVLVTFYAIDLYHFRKLRHRQQVGAEAQDKTEVTGLHNAFFLAVILGAVFIEHPLMLREVIMASAAFASYFTTTREVHRSNNFNFLPIKEVAILFAGIFATMVPALDWLELNARVLGLVTPGHYYWATGALSSFLDNAPTYLNFLSAAFGLHGASVDNANHVHAMLGYATAGAASLPNPLKPDALPITPETWNYVLAISVAAVFFGACTYIGNGPNFMVKSIAEQAKVKCPSFFGYIVKFSIPILVPVFALIWFIFFRT
ncbi:MAG: sodium:proton antiporter [Acidobacteria bacterium]|nr:MAG: sodium:proton antiporter [Acidobacteriota bacterium]